MSTSISISALPVIGLPLQATDNIIISRGANQDYRTTMQAVWTIATTAFPTATTVQATDLVMIWSGGSPFMTTFNNVGFITGTTMWFYSASAPSGWQVVSVAGDAMLGVMSNASGDVFTAGGTTQNNSGGGDGSGQFTWKMTSAQIPEHQHGINSVPPGDIAGAPNYSVVSAKSSAFRVISPITTTFQIGSSTWGTWRPVTAIGVLASKL